MVNPRMIVIRLPGTPYGTFGVLLWDEVPFAVSLERIWMQNQPEISCIPSGMYLAKRVNSSKFGDTFEVTNVPNRSHILFHKGNLDDDTHGCILVGEQYGSLKQQPGIQASREGFNEFKWLARGLDEFWVRFRDV